MVFSDPSFLFYFLPLALVLYWVGGWRRRNFYLLLISLVFYTSGGGGLVILLIGSSLLTYFVALVLDRSGSESRRKIAQTTGIALLLISLLSWKYLGFAVKQISALTDSFGFTFDVRINLVLPIAISFYTFQCISYLVDVGRRTIVAERSIVTFLCYILFFPHLLAGPIVRFSDVAEQLASKSTQRWDAFVQSCPRFFWGLAKKVLVADQAAHIANAAFGVAGYQLGALDTVVGVVAYSVQIYFDFSGYSDMAIGLAGMFGIKFQENFKRPYSSSSVTDFWRRWHISLSSWFRDYVYFPLGGNRNGTSKTYRNLLLIFVLTGFWHGANWTFMVWGLIHGAALVLERLLLRNQKDFRIFSRFLLRIWTIAVVMFGWLLFRSVDLAHAGELLGALGGNAGFGLSPLVREAITPQRAFWTMLGFCVFFLPPGRSFGERLIEIETTTARRLLAVAMGLLAAMYALSSSFSPFLYFQF